MAYDDAFVIDNIKKTHTTEVLSEREKHLIGLAHKVEGKNLATHLEHDSHWNQSIPKHPQWVEEDQLQMPATRPVQRSKL